MPVPGIACTYSDKKRNGLCTLGEQHLWPRDGDGLKYRSANPSPPLKRPKKQPEEEATATAHPKEAQKRKYSLLAPQWWQRMARPPSEDKLPQEEETSPMSQDPGMERGTTSQTSRTVRAKRFNSRPWATDQQAAYYTQSSPPNLRSLITPPPNASRYLIEEANKPKKSKAMKNVPPHPQHLTLTLFQTHA